MRKNFDGVALVAPTSLPYEKFSEHGAAWFFGRMLASLVESSGINKSDIDGLGVASFTLAPDSVIGLAQQFNMAPSWIEQFHTGGASGVMALQRAARAVQAGDAEIIACIGADTNPRGGFKDTIANFSTQSKYAVYPYGATGPNSVFSLLTANYMNTFGVGREDFGRICIAQRYNAHHYPQALLKKLIGMEDYLSARPIAEPLHLLDCVMPCAGGEGFLVMSVERAQRLDLPYVAVKSAAEQHNAFYDDEMQVRGGWQLYRDALYEMAGISADDIDFLQAYDDYPVIVMLQLEGLGFCAPGEAAQFVRDKALTFDGKGLPVNTNGGQLSVGQAGAAGGFIGLVEAIRQLLNEAGDNQVPDAKFGMVSGYGMVVYDRCLCTSAAILARADA
jgi:acetyl-CoA acetyltransferase